MIDFDRKGSMIASDKPIKSPRLSNKLSISIPSGFRLGEVSPASDSACLAYEHYLRLAELKKLWDCREFPNWKNELILRPALQALEITFRLVSTIFSDPRPYINRREWKRRLESLATNQVAIIALLCEDEAAESGETAPTVGRSSDGYVFARKDSSAEVWKLSSEKTVVNRGSENSLLPRLATWRTTEDVAQNILYCIECQMRRCLYTLGLGEPNLSGKPNLDYDLICKPSDLRKLKKCPTDNSSPYNRENQTAYTTHQILECWIRVVRELLRRVAERIDSNELDRASNDCWLIERIWKLLEQIEDLHLLMDPDDFLRLKSQLAVKSDSAAFCFRSIALVEITKSCKNLRHRVPDILGVEVDPSGGPRLQEAAMNLYRAKANEAEYEKIHLIQAMQAIESSVKRFYHAYKQVMVMIMGSLEAKGNQSVVSVDSEDLLAHIFLEPTYYPSLDAAKTFMGDRWSRDQ